jgi:hypothetical protein
MGGRGGRVHGPIIDSVPEAELQHGRELTYYFK